jgi:diaminohydroxyphosphoribosylaminopyrimidine deaminase/5-amino-6-(5-phosphoribosylamino)uracil reductase
VSADGKTGLAGRKPAPISGEPARAKVHLMRAMNDAILIGIGTALADDPQLTCRLPGMAARSPVRVVLDTSLRLPVAGSLAGSARETPVWVMTSESAPSQSEAALVAQGVEVFRVPSFRGQMSGVAGQEGVAAAFPTHGSRLLIPGKLALPAVLALLATRGITRLMVEGGPIVAAAFLAADLVDEAVLLRSPHLIGPDGIDALEAMPLTALTDSLRLRARGIETVGADTIETFERA